MRKFTLFIASLFLALGAKADFTQTYVKNNNGAFWGSAVTELPSGVTNVKPSNAGNVFSPDFLVEVTNDGSVTVSFEHKTGNHGLNVLGVDLLNPAGSVVSSSYSHKIAGGGVNAGQKVYTMDNVEKGIYTLRYFVCNITGGDDVVQAGGDVVVTNAVLATAISRTGWGVTASSQETSRDQGQATNAIDGNENTFWHTVYENNYPHWIEFDAKAPITIYFFDYVSRFDNTTSNGNILNYKLYVSNAPMNGTYTNATLAAQGTFVYGSGRHHIIGLQTPTLGRYIALVAESGTAGNWSGNAATAAANCAEFNVYGIEKKAVANEEKKEELRSKIEWVVAFDQIFHMIGDAVGQYSSSNDDFADDFVEIQYFYNDITEETSIDAIEDKIAALEGLIATFSPNMPVNGKAYTFKNVQNDGETVCWFRYNNGCIELTTNEDEATAFICRSLENGKYAFTMNAGKYMIWRGSNAGYYGNKGVSEFFDAYADFIINKMTTHNNFEGDFSTTRYMTIQGHRNDNNNDVYNYYVIKKNNGNPIFDQANAPFYNGNYSSAFIMDEVVYANKPTLNAVGTSELMTSDLHNKVMATFSAPFPTVVPAGVTAYYATDGDSYVSLKAIEGAVPANTGVILVGDYEEAVTVAMAPAAGETVATVEGNVLAHSAGDAVEISGGYILGAKNGVAGFYKANSGTLAMNKAYIAANGNQESVEIRLPGTTAISEVKGENENVKAIYDLTGRRVEAVAAPGIYIVNGKKVLVK